jgi:hypothetical protein
MAIQEAAAASIDEALADAAPLTDEVLAPLPARLQRVSRVDVVVGLAVRNEVAAT